MQRERWRLEEEVGLGEEELHFEKSGELRPWSGQRRRVGDGGRRGRLHLATAVVVAKAVGGGRVALGEVGPRSRRRTKSMGRGRL